MQALIERAVEQVGRVLLGKEAQLRLALCCLLARGHLLIEDLPGMGKTTLANALARVLGLDYQRVQFTSDLLPADILGLSVFDRERAQFDFVPGPIFTQVLLADEINRSTPKTQSALLEAMEERQVTVEGKTRALPHPFFVIATQNPQTQSGTYPLPESQLDRFFMRIALGYPDPQAERQLLMGEDVRALLQRVPAVMSAEQLIAIQRAVETVHCSEQLVSYVQRLVGYSREAASFSCGLSPRAALALLRGAKSWALMHGRTHVLPEDVQQVLPAVVEHRISAALDYHAGAGQLTQKLLQDVAVLA